jgi:hypothetical protein
VCRSEAAVAGFSARVEPVLPFQRQLPVGLFDGAVARAQRWTPAGHSQVDLWTPSRDGRAVHLLELKARHGGRPNAPLGILPEALCYLRLLHRIRVGLPHGRRVAGDGQGLRAIRACERLVVWLATPGLHPLLLHRGDSPLAWLASPLRKQGCELGILPVEVDEAGDFAGWGAPTRFGAST